MYVSKHSCSTQLTIPKIDASDKEPACQCRRCKRRGFDAWVRKISWRRKWQPTPGFCLENPMERGAWHATVHTVTKNWTQLKQLSMHAQKIRSQEKNKIRSQDFRHIS